MSLTGRFDAYIERSVNWWDIAAGVLLVNCAGGPVGYRSKPIQNGETLGDCLERKNRPRSTHQDISMSFIGIGYDVHRLMKAGS